MREEVIEMSTSTLKCRRTSTEQASPRADTKKSKRCIFAPTSPTSSSSQSPSPPRRRDALKSTVINVFRPRTTAVPQYRGVRHREELNKYVSEIRPTRCSKKIWLGTYDTAEEAARAFDIGNLCCKKNLPLNFPDSPSMLKKISSQLSPEETRSAIAKLAKEVARVYSNNPNSNDDVAKQEPVDQVTILHRPEFVQNVQAFQSRPEPELPQIQHLAAAGVYSTTYIEQLPENVCAMEEVATAMPLGERAGAGSRSWSFDLSIGDVSLTDNLTGIPFLIDTPDVGPDQMFEDHMYIADQILYDNHMCADQMLFNGDRILADQILSEDHMHGDVYFYSHQ